MYFATQYLFFIYPDASSSNLLLLKPTPSGDPRDSVCALGKTERFYSDPSRVTRTQKNFRKSSATLVQNLFDQHPRSQCYNRPTH